MKRNENFWSYRLHKLGTPKVLRTDGRTDGQTDRRTDGRTDGRSGPTTRPAFAKATQVKIESFKDNVTYSYTIPYLSPNMEAFCGGAVY